MNGTPRGVRNFNPGNIRHGASWAGLSGDQPDKDFCTFISPAWGIRAIAKILKTYQTQGINTVQGVIARWAPPSENDTGAYVSSVCHSCGVTPDEPIVLTDHLPDLIKAIVRHENGMQPYDDATIDLGISLA